MAAGSAAITSRSTCPMSSAARVAAAPTTARPPRRVLAQQFLDDRLIRLGVAGANRVERARQHLVVGLVAIERHDVDDLLVDGLRQFSAKLRHEVGVTEDHDPRDLLGVDDARQDVGHFLHVLLMEVLDVALIARLRPAADLHLLRFLPFDISGVRAAAGREYEHPGTVGVHEDGRIPRPLVVEAGQRIEVRPVADHQLMGGKRRFDLHRLEQAGAGAGKEREAACARLELGVDIGRDPLEIRVETCAGIGRERVAAQPIGELAAEIRPEGRSSIAAWRRVEVEAQHRQRHRFERGERIYRFSDDHRPSSALPVHGPCRAA